MMCRGYQLEHHHTCRDFLVDCPKKGDENSCFWWEFWIENAESGGISIWLSCTSHSFSAGTIDAKPV